jgi:hypothetical protein
LLTATLFVFGSAAIASSEPKRTQRKAKSSNESKSSSSATSAKSGPRKSGSGTTSRKQDYKSKHRPVKPPPSNGGRHGKIKKIRPEIRPPKEKTPRPVPGEFIRPVPPPRYPIEVWPIYFPPVDECEWIEVPAPVYDYDDGDRLREVETASLLLSGATMVWNGVFINAGEPNELVATAGFFTGPHFGHRHSALGPVPGAGRRS